MDELKEHNKNLEEQIDSWDRNYKLLCMVNKHLQEELKESKWIIKKAEQHVNTTCLSIPNETLDRIFRGIDDSDEE